MMFKRKGGGVKGLLNNVKKNCTFLKGWLPLFDDYLMFVLLIFDVDFDFCYILLHDLLSPG